MDLDRLAFALACGVVLAGCGSWVPTAGRGEPLVSNYRAEDDSVRIDEQRVRGQLKRVAVSPKAEGAASYEVLPPGEGQDPSKNRDSAGQRVWSVFTF